MAQAALRLRRDVIGDLRRGDARGVAGSAVTGIYPQMTECDAGKGVVVEDIVTRGAVQRCRQVIEGLARGDTRAVAECTVTRIYAHVVEHRVREVNRVVAYHAILGGRNVVVELAECDRIVMAGRTVVDHTEVVVDTGRKGTGSVADAAVLRRRHMTGVHARGGDAMAGSAVVHDSGVIEYATCETVRVVAGAAIRCGRGVTGHRGTLPGCVDAVVVVVARFTRLQRCFDPVIEDTSQTEGVDTVAGGTVDERLRVARDRSGCRHTMAGITAVADHCRPRVVRIRAFEGCRRVARTAFSIRVRMRRGGCLTYGNRAVVTTRAFPQDA